MKKIFTKILAMALLVVSVASLCACSSNPMKPYYGNWQPVAFINNGTRTVEYISFLGDMRVDIRDDGTMDSYYSSYPDEITTTTYDKVDVGIKRTVGTTDYYFKVVDGELYMSNTSDFAQSVIFQKA